MIFNAKLLLEDMAKEMDRFNIVIRTKNRCPKCDDVQIQILDWRPRLTEWRCRICKHRFTVEVPI